MTPARPFLTAQWRHLVMLNYAANPDLLEPYLPGGTELDLWQGQALFSLVGFQFLKTRIKGWRVPFHQRFAEVNLRFYVRRLADDGWRRGVVFIKEVVSKPAVTWVANTFYREHYLTRPLSHRIQVPASITDRTGLAEYRWRCGPDRYQISATFRGLPHPLRSGSEEEFIAEHYWGYTRHPDGTTSEYRVDHPPWRVWETEAAAFQGDAAKLYGRQFAEIVQRPPRSFLVADGSEVTVFEGRRFADPAGSDHPAAGRLTSATVASPSVESRPAPGR